MNHIGTSEMFIVGLTCNSLKSGLVGHDLPKVELHREVGKAVSGILPHAIADLLQGAQRAQVRIYLEHWRDLVTEEVEGRPCLRHISRA